MAGALRKPFEHGRSFLRVDRRGVDEDHGRPDAPAAGRSKAMTVTISFSRSPSRASASAVVSCADPCPPRGRRLVERVGRVYAGYLGDSSHLARALSITEVTSRPSPDGSVSSKNSMWGSAEGRWTPIVVLPPLMDTTTFRSSAGLLSPSLAGSSGGPLSSPPASFSTWPLSLPPARFSVTSEPCRSWSVLSVASSSTLP